MAITWGGKPHTWYKKGLPLNAAGEQQKTIQVSDTTHEMYYRGQRIAKAIYRGNVIWERQEGYDVCFWDWEGTLRGHYTAESFLAMREFPNLHYDWHPSEVTNGLDSDNYPWQGPDESLFEPDGYNWTFEEAREFVKKFRYCDIGLLYKSDYTYLWRLVPGDNRTALFFIKNTSGAGATTIDYGDGTSELVPYSGALAYTARSHTYASAGRYLVKIKGPVWLGGWYSTSSGTAAGPYAGQMSVDQIIRQNMYYLGNI